jgi:sulfite exporter TauE/SafE/copper chaperone CopZ
MNQIYTFHVQGMHCNACILMTESELLDLPHVNRAKSSLKSHTIEVDGDFGNRTKEEITQEFNNLLLPRGYTVSVDWKKQPGANWKEFNIAVPIAIAFGIGFVLLQKAGLVNLVTSSNVSYSTAFVIGIIASLSTCMAVVGGLLLSMSATFAREGDQVKPQILFHVGRLISFFVLGGAIGSIGSVFQFSGSASLILSLIIALVMLILGVNLLDVFPWAKKFQPSTPKFLSKHALGVSKMNHTLTPFLVGIVTFFLPCGFTQSMQIYTLSTGSFLVGGLTMLSFALGTLPVLALVSFSSFSIQNSSKSGIFFKSAGLIVIMFAVFNLINGLVAAGILAPVFNF